MFTFSNLYPNLFSSIEAPILYKTEHVAAKTWNAVSLCGGICSCLMADTAAEASVRTWFSNREQSV